MKQSFSICLGVCVFLLSGCGVPAETPAPTASLVPPTEEPAGPTYSDQPYMEDGNPKHTLDIYLPDEAEGSLPTLLMIHGALDFKEDHSGVGDYFADQGYAVVITEYQTEVDQQISIQDLFCSLAWVHANADQYHFDSQRVYLFGYSLGGFFSATLSAMEDPSQYQAGCAYPIPETDRIRGVITFAGLFVTQEVCLSPQGGWCMSGIANANKIPLMEMAGIFETLREVPPSNWEDSSELSDEVKIFAGGLPLYWIDGTEPPFLIIHGDVDDMVPIGESEAFAKAVQAAGGNAEFIALPGAGHFSLTLNSPSFTQTAAAMENFMAEY